MRDRTGSIPGRDRLHAPQRLQQIAQEVREEVAVVRPPAFARTANTFLDKPVPDMDFPHANAMGTGWKQREDQVTKLWVGKAFRNMAVIFGTIVGIGAVCYKYL